MPDRLYLNLPVKDLNDSMAFFRKLGFTFNPQFTDATAACMVVSDSIFVMLLTHDKFQMFTPRPISDARQQTEMLAALSCGSEQEVHAMVTKALEAGATRVGEPKDYGFMIQDGFADLDGHIWEVFYMDMSKFPQPSP